MLSDLNRLIATFEQMEKDGFDTKQQLRWGFFFIDSDEIKLRNLYKELIESGYALTSLEKTDNPHLWALYVNKIDVLSPEKLHKRNIAFNQLAEHCGVELYDGWDVEKI
jgi:Regulator of ribonuclease activity B